ncbi:MAG: GtrA family protein [Bacteroidales bacterium]|nr:GtrA family protein [Bacteroidales bacterium]
MKIGEFIGKLLKGPSGDIRIQAFRYLISGGTAFVVDTGLLALLTKFFGSEGCRHYIWVAVAFCAGLLITYLFSILWVFDNRSLKSRAAEVGIFVVIGVIGLGLTELLLSPFQGKVGLEILPYKIMATVIVFIWNFAAKKLILFRSK